MLRKDVRLGDTFIINKLLPKIIHERLGHSNFAMTIDTYSHIALGLQKMALPFPEILSKVTKISKTLL